MPTQDKFADWPRPGLQKQRMCWSWGDSLEKIMLGKWAKVIWLTVLLSGLCASAQAITTVAANEDSAVAATATPPADADNAAAPVRVALLLPLRSSVFGAAADAVRTGFLTASERKKDNIVITIIETGDAAQEVLNAYNDASGKYDIIVGPLSRSAVTALVQSAAVRKPTIALGQPDLPDTADQRLPRQMIMMGLSIEEEARQVAAWVEHEKTPGKIFAVSTNIAWQRRAVKAFTQQARQQGMTVENLELSVPNNALSATGLAQLGQRIQTEKPALLFVALDAAQTIQLRSIKGNKQQGRLFRLDALAKLCQTGRAQCIVGHAQFQVFHGHSLLARLLSKCFHCPALPGDVGRHGKDLAGRLLMLDPGGNLARFFFNRQSHHDHLARQSLIGRVGQIGLAQRNGRLAHGGRLYQGRHCAARQRTNDDVVFSGGVVISVEDFLGGITGFDDGDDNVVFFALGCCQETGTHRIGGRAEHAGT